MKKIIHIVTILGLVLGATFGGALIVDASICPVIQGCTGVNTLNGVILGNGTAPVSTSALPADATKYFDGTGNFSTPAGGGGGGSGTVTSVSVVTAQGVSGSVATATTTPAITLSLGALTGVTSFNGLVITANTGVITTGTWNGTAIANANLANSAVTVNGTSISLGASGTVTAAAGTLTGTTLNSSVVTSSLTSVGTLASGTWQGNPVGTLYGGTGSTSLGGGLTNSGSVLALDLTSANIFTAVQTVNKSTLGVTTVDGLLLNNTTAAALAAQQVTPSLHFQSFGWGTTASTSQSTDWRTNSLPVQGATPSANLLTQFSLAGGAYTTELTLQSNGALIANGAISGNGGLNTFSGSPQVANFFSNAGSNMVGTSTAPQANFGGGSATIYVRTLIGGTTTGTPANTSNGANLVIGSTPFTIANGSSSAWLVNTVINPLGTITLTGTGSVGNTASLYIGGASAGTVTGANYSLYINSGNSLMNGNLTLGTAGNKLNITTGTNASIGTATLVGGTVTVSTTAVTASSKIFLTDATTGTLTNIGTPTVGTVTAGTSFVINSSNVLDTSNINWFIIN